jgi:phosphatidylethanolamine-binding protein (PEBP) family uncharacterized protein
MARSTGALGAPVLCALLLALAALAGCGGGGGGGSEDSASDATSTASSGQGGKASAPSASEKQAAAAAQRRTTAESPDSKGQTQGKEKHGSRIKPAKGAPERAPSKAEIAHSAVDSIALQPPGFTSLGSEYEIPATYTCDGRETSPELRWSGVPVGSAELILFVLNLEPIEGALFFDWAVAGLEPSLEGLAAGEVPKGAILGKNGFGKEAYSLCPPGGKRETYVFALYALPKALSPKRGFDPAKLREEVLGVAGNVGLLAAAYGRG